MATMYDFTALSKRIVANNIDLWVSSGSHQAPFYRFYADSEGSIEVSGLNINSSNTYSFQRFNSSNSHPFYISDTGYKLAHSRSVNIAGDGSEISGIKGDQVVTVSFNDNSIDNLYYFCTSHPGMFAEFSLIESAAGILGRPGIVIIAPQTTTINSAPEESLISLIGKACPVGAPFRFGSVEKLY